MGMPLLCRAPIPLHRLVVVLRHALAFFVNDAQIDLSLDVTLVSGQPVPLHRLLIVPRDALPLGADDT